MSARAEAAPNASHEGPTEEAIAQTFGFVDVVLDAPELLDCFPDEATLVFRAIDVDGHGFQLAAARAEGEDAWVARPSRYAPGVDAAPLLRPILGVRADSPNQIAMTLAFARSFSATGPTEVEALDALERSLREAVADAVRGDQSGSNRPG